MPDVYRARIDSVQHKQGPKAQYLGWRLKTIDCVDPDDNDYTLFFNTPIEGRGLGMFTDFCTACGVRWEGGVITPDFVNSLKGLELNVETSITVNPNTGKDQTNVKKCVAQIDAV